MNPKAGCFEKINKISKTFTQLIRKNRERNKMNKIRNERGEITTDTKKYKRLQENIMSNYMSTNCTI